jgi:hypothetical protein
VILLRRCNVRTSACFVSETASQIQTKFGVVQSGYVHALKNHNFVTVPLYGVLVVKPEEKVPLVRCMRGWEL